MPSKITMQNRPPSPHIGTSKPTVEFSLQTVDRQASPHTIDPNRGLPARTRTTMTMHALDAARVVRLRPSVPLILGTRTLPQVGKAIVILDPVDVINLI